MGIPWGSPDMRPVPGDYNGDGTWDLAVYHRATGKWYIRELNGNVLAYNRAWGGATHPVSGDFNGDGPYDLAVHDRG